MKNKKLFAILTLVCFMMTLMPVAAFAADTVTVDKVTVKYAGVEKAVEVEGNYATAAKGSTVENVVVELNSAVELTAEAAIKTTIWNAEKDETIKSEYADYTELELDTDGKKLTITPDENAATANFEGVIEFYAEGIEGIDAKTVMFTLAVQVDADAADDAMEAFEEGTVEFDGEEADGQVLTIPEGKKVATTEITVDLGVKGFASVSKSVGGTVTAEYKDGKIILTAVPTDLPQVIEATIAYGMNPMARSGNEITVTLYVPAKNGGYAYDGTKDAHRDYSKVWTVEENETVKVGKAFEITAALKNKVGAVTEPMFVWFTANGDSDEIGSGAFTVVGASAATVVEALDANGVPTAVDGLWYVPANAGVLEVTAHKTGTYTLHAVTVADFLAADKDSNDNLEELFDDLRDMKTIAGHNTVVVKGIASASDYDFVMPATVGVDANGIAKEKVTVTLTDGGDAVIGETVKIETNSANVEVSKASAVTNGLGQFSFNVSAVREGKYEIYVSCGNYEETITVFAGATTPTHIAVAKAPTAPIALADVAGTTQLDDTVRFVITDINGNTLTAAQAAGQQAFSDEDKYYVSVVSQPVDSDLTNEDVYLTEDLTNNPTGIYSTLKIVGGLKVEGVYEFKVALDNGNSVRVAVEVKEFQTPVGIVLEYAAPSVELGGTLYAKAVKFVDANGVLKDARSEVKLAASGYAIDDFNAYYIKAKTDEKYLGSTITVTAVSERYDLITTATVKVVAEAAGLMFTNNTAEVDVNNPIQVVLVDTQGNRTALSHEATADVSYVVLEKPEGAKVAVSTSAADYNLERAGSFKMNLTCNKVGTVKVQAIAKVTTLTDGKEVVKYYTGVQEFAVGTGEIGKSVVMSIGSNELIVGAKVEKMDSKPMIQNGRTFVPFRALAEAFGATVAYDQATSSVTAELNGVKVVMTVGAPVYTVNGVEKTADVAPFISDSRTFVPVRFAAEAFGIEVVPTYNEDGSVADVLFNM